MKNPKISKTLPQRNELWGLFIKLEAHKEGTFEEFARINKSLTRLDLKRLTICYVKK